MGPASVGIAAPPASTPCSSADWLGAAHPAARIIHETDASPLHAWFGHIAGLHALGFRPESNPFPRRRIPESARLGQPRTWWHWTGGNVSKEGITKDLEWMKRVGIGGMHLADVSSGSGQTVGTETRVWQPGMAGRRAPRGGGSGPAGAGDDDFQLGGLERNGRTVGQARGSDEKKWSGANWRSKGRQKFAGKLPAPPSNNGSFQNTGGGGADPTFYGDSAVVAFRTPSDEIDLAALKPLVTQSSGATNDVSYLYDGDFTTGGTIAVGARPASPRLMPSGSRAGAAAAAARQQPDAVARAGAAHAGAGRVARQARGAPAVRPRRLAQPGCNMNLPRPSRCARSPSAAAVGIPRGPRTWRATMA